MKLPRAHSRSDVSVSQIYYLRTNVVIGDEGKFKVLFFSHLYYNIKRTYNQERRFMQNAAKIYF